MKIFFEQEDGTVVFSKYQTREGEKLLIDVEAGTYQISEGKDGRLLITPIEDK